MATFTAPHDQKATFIELFFDLVFVFSVTQVVSLFHDGITWLVVGQVVLVFWLVWWGWSQFTWALNAADTKHWLIDLLTLVATGVAFFMAISLPEAFHELGLWFGVTYVLLRAVGLSIYLLVARENEKLRQALVRWLLLSIGGFAAVLVGAILGGTAQYWLWGLAIILDLFAATATGQAGGDWNIQPDHFAERHGLFTIIALGETLIVAAAGVSHAAWDANLLILAGLAVAITGGLWWTYYPHAHPRLERGLAKAQSTARSNVARDAFSLSHFPMILGIVAYAVAIEFVVAHPGEAMHTPDRAALAAGILLFVGGTGMSLRRATGLWDAPRLLLTLLTAALVFFLDGSAMLSLMVALTGVIAVAITQHKASHPFGDL